MEIAFPLTRLCQDNGLVKYWLKIVQETWICELLLLNNWNTVDTAKTPNIPTNPVFIEPDDRIISGFNQSVENADVAFVKGANERNEFFEKINKQ